MANVLVISDEPESREALRACLMAGKHVVTVCDRPCAAPRLFSMALPDLLCVDAREDGRKLEDFWTWFVSDEQRSAIPVLFVLPTGARWTDSAAPPQLRPGIDAAISRPLSAADLQEKVDALLARELEQPPRRPQILRLPPLSLDRSTHQLSANGQRVALTPIEYRLLACLMARAGEVVGARELMAEGWGSEPDIASPETARVHLSNLRRKMTSLGCNDFLQTLPHRGYRLQKKRAQEVRR